MCWRRSCTFNNVVFPVAVLTDAALLLFQPSSFPFRMCVCALLILNSPHGVTQDHMPIEMLLLLYNISSLAFNFGKAALLTFLLDILPIFLRLITHWNAKKINCRVKEMKSSNYYQNYINV